MAAIVQQGTSVVIGFNGITLTGTVLQSASAEGVGVVDVLRNTDGATMTKLISDLGTRISFEAIVTDGATYDAPPAIGSVISLNFNSGGAANYMVESSSVAFSAKEARISLTVVKEVSMTYS